MDRDLDGTWEVQRWRCDPCVALEIEMANDTEGGRSARGRKYSVRQAEEGR